MNFDLFIARYLFSYDFPKYGNARQETILFANFGNSSFNNNCLRAF